MFLFRQHFVVWLSATPAKLISENEDPDGEIPVLQPLSGLRSGQSTISVKGEYAL